MPVHIDIVFKYFKDAFGRILIVAGLASIIVGLLYSSAEGSLSFALALFFGAFLFDLGLCIHFELFYVKLRSKEGFGNIMVFAGSLLITSGIIFVFFAEPDPSRAYILPPFRLGFPKEGGLTTVIIPLIRVYLWLAIPLAFVGVILLVVGVLLKIFDAIF